MKAPMRFFITLLSALLLMLALPLQADTAPSPRDVIVKAVNNMTQAIDEHRDELKENPDYASTLIEAEADRLLAFKRITRLVMGKWFSKATNDQRYHFLDVFKQSLIDTYASGITLYDGQKIEVLPLRDNDIRKNRAYVRMQVGTNSGQDILVSYTMINKHNTWQVENIIVNGLNLGKTFQSQFDQSAQKFNGNLDKVIDNWANQLKGNNQLANPEDNSEDTSTDTKDEPTE